MQPLVKQLRTRLERTVKEARDIAEIAARAAIDQLGVGNAAPYSHLTNEQRELRWRLRIHSRGLGDSRDPKTEIQELDLLTEEIAYEHWHRMLFTRFLAENNLLMYPDPETPVPVTIAECADLAKEKGVSNGWELASLFAARMLPQIFRPDAPVFELLLPPEHAQRLEQLIMELPPEVFNASDALGWVYQFWQAKKKDEVNASEIKIGARELPAVTQLFTEPYMVSFLLDNSLGAWWSKKRLTAADLANAGSEQELRNKASLPGIPLAYLRFVKQENGTWTPAAGTFAAWPGHLNALKILDPCCGSGHFLVAAFLMLVPMRMELEKITAREAIDRVLTENIHGLEIDKRCVELAAFALGLTAWRYPGAGGYRRLPELNLACSGLAVGASKQEWKQFAAGNKNLGIALDWMYDVFKDAPVLGSLLNPAATDAARIVEWEELSQVLAQALTSEKSEEKQETAVIAHGLSKAALLLSAKYNWVITNVPYLARGKQGDVLRDFCTKHYDKAKHDLSTVFLERCLEFCVEDGTASIVLPQNWLFLTSYRKFREHLLTSETWHIIARLGAGAFETISGEVVKAILIAISKGNPNAAGSLFDDGEKQLIHGIDVSASRTAHEKATELHTAEIKCVEQAKQLENPDARVALEEGEDLDLLEKYAYSYQGISPADFPRFGRCFWEMEIDLDEWIFWQSTVFNLVFFGGREHILWIKEVRSKVEVEKTAYIRGEDSWGKNGIGVSAMRSLPVTLSTGNASDTNVAIIIPIKPTNYSAIWCFCSSPLYNEAVRRIDQKLNVTNATLVKVPFDLDHWTEAARDKYPNGLPQPFSDDPTQWIFHGHPCGSVVWDEEKKQTAVGVLRTDETVLQTAVARLLGYRWPAELDADLELCAEARSLVEKSRALAAFGDEDGVVCIPSVRGEPSAADRLLNILAASYGKEWNNEILARLLKSADHAGKTVETWLRDKFFVQHCKLFHNRPFIWHIWDGLNDGFAVLVNYHKLDAKLLETLIYTCLGNWITHQKSDIKNSVDGAEEKLAAAEQLKKRLELIRAGEAPYDIFVRWKPIAKQPVGWNPDLNDGVRLNIRPFLSVPDMGKKGSGVLRDKPHIDWNKDRGKDVETAPRFPLFKGERINDHHLTLEEKKNVGS